MSVPKQRWVWMPHPAHYICSHLCRFHLATAVGNVIVSTVGEMVSGGRDVAEFEEIGSGRLYETMVFSCEPSKPGAVPCCPFRVAEHSELESDGYNDAGAAYEGHLAMCSKWAAKRMQDSVPQLVAEKTAWRDQ